VTDRGRPGAPLPGSTGRRNVRSKRRTHPGLVADPVGPAAPPVPGDPVSGSDPSSRALSRRTVGICPRSDALRATVLVPAPVGPTRATCWSGSIRGEDRLSPVAGRHRPGLDRSGDGPEVAGRWAARHGSWL